MSGGAGNDIYFVDNAGDSVFENSGEGTDVVFSSAHFGLSANVETLVLQGSADLQLHGGMRGGRRALQRWPRGDRVRGRAALSRRRARQKKMPNEAASRAW